MALEFDSDATDLELDARVRDLINDELLAAYWKAAAHYQSDDLVLVYSDDEPNSIDFFRRKKLISEPDCPEFMRAKLSKPARSARSAITESDAAFWLVASFSDEKMACVAVKAKRLSPPGRA